MDSCKEISFNEDLWQKLRKWDPIPLRLLRPTVPKLRRFTVCKCLKNMAGTTGLEPATSAVTGQRSNQLNYVPAFIWNGLA